MNESCECITHGHLQFHIWFSPAWEWNPPACVHCIPLVSMMCLQLISVFVLFRIHYLFIQNHLFIFDHISTIRKWELAIRNLGPIITTSVLSIMSLRKSELIQIWLCSTQVVSEGGRRVLFCFVLLWPSNLIWKNLMPSDLVTHVAQQEQRSEMALLCWGPNFAEDNTDGSNNAKSHRV